MAKVGHVGSLSLQQLVDYLNKGKQSLALPNVVSFLATEEARNTTGEIYLAL